MTKGKNKPDKWETTMPTKLKNAMAKKKIYCEEQLVRYFPKNYRNYSMETGLDPQRVNEFVVIIGKIRKPSYYTNIVKTRITDRKTEETLELVWFNDPYMYNIIETFVGRNVIVCGKLIYNTQYCNYSICNPDVFSTDINGNLQIKPVYEKIKNVSDDTLKKNLANILNKKEKETVPQDILSKLHLLGINEALMQKHFPFSENAIYQADKRIVFDQLLYLALSLKASNTDKTDEGFRMSHFSKTESFIQNIGFQLTEDQDKTCRDLIKQAASGKRIDALIQGDVSCGKTAIAIILMMLAAENGFQSVLMAPTMVLAKQHYDSIQKYAEKSEYHAVLLDSSLKVSERKKILEEIKTGKAQFIIGTHSIVSENVEFHNLALSIVDEEHRFGVEQKDFLTKSSPFMHYITMSATPIPRTLATVFYAEKKVYEIKSMPKGRKKVITNWDNGSITPFRIMEELKKGHQAYIVCPLIEEADSGSSMEGNKSVEEITEYYRKNFEPYGFSVGMATGNMKKEELSCALNDFASGKTKILVSTTVIEVGVNVPNATIIAIYNAERFGLFAMHQLRGRVGRGTDQAYCYLISAYGPDINERIKTMCSTTNGFEISEKDFEMRRPGDILGTQQSGFNELVEKMISYPNMYKAVCKIAEKMICDGSFQSHIEKYDKIYQ